LRNLSIDFRHRADIAEHGVDAADRPRLYAEAERYEAAAGDIYACIVAAPAATFAGILAKLEFAGEDPELIGSVIGDLQKLVAKGGAA
jgi:hypothetical protein